MSDKEVRNMEYRRAIIAKKDTRRNLAARALNRGKRTALKNSKKEFLLSQDKTNAFPKLNKAIAKACQQGIIHRNTRDRILRRLFKLSVSVSSKV